MTQIDVFNGDADGICALHQLRLADPVESILVTGVKRKIDLLAGVSAASGDMVTVLDVSLDKNREGLMRLLGDGVAVSYFDHHYAGVIPQHPLLDAHIDPSPETCTSLLVSAHLDGAYLPWAAVGAFGDNLDESARRAAERLGLEEPALEVLRNLGIYLNYNGYGVTLEDLFYHPDELYRRLRPYPDPFAFIAEDEAYPVLRDGYRQDMLMAEGLNAETGGERYAVYVLPDAPWARRVGGVLGNALARKAPARAHALLSRLPDGGYRVSVRAPLATRTGADDLCRAFPTGGGRQAAAGINLLAEDRYVEFVDRFRAQFA